MRALWRVLVTAISAFTAPALAQAPPVADARVNSRAVPPESATAQFRLVRCIANNDAMCVSAALTWPTDTPGADTFRWSAELLRAPMVGSEQLALSVRRDAREASVVSPVFAAPVLPFTSMGRTALIGTIALRDGAGAAVFSAPVSWRPPRVAWPLFSTLADAHAIPTALHEALDIAAEPPSARPLIALLVLVSAILLVGFVPRYLWPASHESDEDVARQLAAARALLTTQELERLRDSAPPEATLRTPDEETAKAIEKPDRRL